MSNRDKTEIMQEVRTLLQSGRLNEAYKLAVDSMPFHLENLEFVQLTILHLRQLGFKEEADSISKFLLNYADFRQKELEKHDSDIERAQTEGHSVGYKLEGKHSNWSDPYWDKRAALIADSIPEKQIVLDLGCGNMLIEKYLAAPQRYIPCDIFKRDERTIVCDFDKLEYPEVENIDYTICLGVLNYLKNQKQLLAYICSLRSKILLSFKPMNLIKHKVEAGIFPESLTFHDTITFLSEKNYSVRYKYLMGQGDEVLFVALPK